MPGESTRLRRHLPNLALRELLTGVLGWGEPAGAPFAVEEGGRRYPLAPLAESHGVVALLCEAPLGAPLPDYAARRRLRARIDAVAPRHLTIFTDAAHSVLVWSWARREPGGPLAYREHSLRPDRLDASLLRELGAATLEMDDGAVPAPAPHPAETVVLTAFLCALERRAGGALLGGGPDDGEEPPAELRQQVQNLIEGADRPELLRACWRILVGGPNEAGLAVLDPACGAGGFLLGALCALEPVYLACLERMQSWVEELDASRARHRPEKLADFRAVLARADDPRCAPSRRHYVRRAILLNNLYGADRDPEAVETCRVRMRMRLAAPGARHDEPALLPLEDNLRVGDPRLGYTTAHEVERGAAAAAAPPGRADRLAEEAESIDRAVRSIRLLSACAPPDPRLPAAAGELHRRRARLAAELDRFLAREHGVDCSRAHELAAWLARRRPCHSFVEFHAVMRRGGFDVVRGGGP